MLQWLYMNGMKYDQIKQEVLAEALLMFPGESSQQTSFLKYITKMAQSHQYLSVSEISAGGYRDGYFIYLFHHFYFV